MPNDNLPNISIIIPCRNENQTITPAVDSLVNQSYPHAKTEIIIIDGLSDDGTVDKIEKLIKKYDNIKMIVNEKKFAVHAINQGIKESQGEIIVRADAHCTYNYNYIETCIKGLIEHNADNVGGTIETIPSNNSLIAQAIAIATSDIFGVGNSSFRLNNCKQPQLVDTVPFGCFPKKIFETYGYFDEEMVRNEDDEFNHRILKNNGKIILLPSAQVKYYARENLKQLWGMLYQYGLFKPLVGKKVGKIVTVRQIIPPVFVLVNILALLLLIFKIIPYQPALFPAAIYLLSGFSRALFLGVKHKNMNIVIPILMSFIVMHWAYGLGYLSGTYKFIIKKTNNDNSKINLTR